MLAAEDSSASKMKSQFAFHSSGVSPYASSKESLLLLETKHVVPRLPSALVKRERLLKDLDAVFEHRLLLLSASAGSGKTTLLCTWASCSTSTSHDIVWLSLDELDNDSTRFWTLIASALHARSSIVGEIALTMLHSPQPPPLSTILTTLLNDLTDLNQEIVLVLDDYHVIEDPVIHDSLSFWLDHLPATFHIMLATRVDPTIPLSRWRVRGQLAEMHDADLRFTTEETTRFLTQAIGHTLSQEDVILLESRTEGWIAGLQLAVLSLHKRKDPSGFLKAFTGSHRYIVDYVQEEILQQQPISVQHFLLQTAVLTRMNASLCQAVTEEQEIQTSQKILEALERSNLFVIPLDEQRQWYRYHSLFREVLLARLQENQPTLVSLLHQRAARWYKAQGSFHEAIAHAFAAEDYAFAVSMMERETSQLWMHGEAKMVSTWVMMLPDILLQEHMDVALTSALNLLESTQNMPEQQWTEARIQSEQIIRRIEHALQSERNAALSEAEQMRLHNRIRLLRGLLEMRTALQEGNMRQVRHIAQQMQPLTVQEPVDWKRLPLYGLFMSAQLLGDTVLLLPELLAVKQQALQEQDSYTAVVVMCWLAAAFLYGGQLHSLYQECVHVQNMVEQLDCHLAIAAYPALDLAFFYYATNQLEKAETCLESVIQHAHHWQDRTLLLWSYGIFVKVLLASGKVTKAEQTLQEAQHVIQQMGLTATPEVMAAQVSLWLTQANLSAAGAWAIHVLFDPNTLDFIHEEEYMALARVYFAQQQYIQCLHLLAQLLIRAERLERRWDIIHILALQVAVLHACGEHTHARQVVVRLLTLTEPEGYIRVYLDAGEPMQQVLQSFLETQGDDTSCTTVVSFSYVSLLLSAFEQEKRKSSLLHQVASQTETHLLHPVSSALVEPLTSREQDVLRLLAEGATNQDIARQLVVSLTTVKKHVGNLLLKLAAENRTHAVARARELSLL